MHKRQNPYHALGERLQSFRKKLQETIHEVSGAVELETEVVASFERGEARPSEDILELLINHFDIRDDEADELWDLAGYGKSGYAQEETPTVPTIIMFSLDNRIVYTDTANVTINNFGVVMNFMQNGPGGQPAAVARVGMSLDHAKSVLEVLEKTIKQADTGMRPKLLPEPAKEKETEDNKQD